MPNSAPQAPDAFFINPEGETIAVDAAQAPAFAQARGYVPASPDQVSAYQAEQRFGGAAQGAAAFAEGAAKSATLGLSTLLERGVGIDPEGIAGRAEHRNLLHGAGELAGIAVPLATGVGAPAAVAKVGAGATGAVAKAVPAGASLLGRMASRAAAVGAGSAVEGAFYGAGQVVHEAALGDPRLTAESALATVGLSAALGGAFGGVLGAGEAALPAAVAKARDAAAGLVAKARGAYPAVAEAIGAAPADAVASLIAQRAQTMAPEARAVLAGDVARSLEDVNTTVERALRLANREIRPAEVDALLPGAHEAVAAKVAADPASAADILAGQSPAQTEARRLAFRLDSAARHMRDAPEAFPGMYPNKLEAIAAGLRRDAADAQPAAVFRAINDAKQNIDPLAKFGALASPEHRDAILAVKAVRGQLKASLEDEAVWGQAAARQSAFNDAQNEYLTAKRNYESAFGLKTVTRTGAVARPTATAKVNTWLNQLGTPQGELRTQALDAMQAAQKHLLDQIEASHASAPAAAFDRKAIDSLVNKTGEQIAGARQQAAGAAALAKLAPGGPTLGSAALDLGLGHAIGGPAGAALGAAHTLYRFLGDVPKSVAALGALERMITKVDTGIAAGASALVRAVPIAERISAPAADRAAHATRTAEVTRLANDPAAMMTALGRQAAALHDHAPQTSTALGVTSAKAVAFLASKVPQVTAPGPLAPRPEVSAMARAKFARYQEAVDRPQVLLEHARQGTLTAETVEAVSTVYPALFAKMRSALVDAIAARGPEGIPFRNRQAISMILGQDTDGSLQLIPRTQATYARGRGAAAPPGGAPTHQPQQANRYMTDSQKSANRR